MPSSRTVTLSGNAATDGVIAGMKWSTNALTYSFGTSSYDYIGDYGRDEEAFKNFESFNAAQRAAVKQAYAQLSAFTNLTFTEVSGAKGTLRFGMTDDTATAHAYYPSGFGKGGDSWFNNSGGRYDAPLAGNYAFHSFIHEIGHSLGLKHSHEDGAVPEAQDMMEFTVMSYKAHLNDNGSTYPNETAGFAQTYMMLDIAALQHLYGANYTTNSTNTTYSWNPLTGAMSTNGTAGAAPVANRVFMTMWDGGGIDTYDLSNYQTAVTVDLRPGEWTITSQVQLANLGNGVFARGNVANSLLFNNDTRSLIENARGGSGDDVLIGNEVANLLDGGQGADKLTGGAGADTFLFRPGDAGGSGHDFISDFKAGQDKIDLQAFGQVAFIGSTEYSGAANQLRVWNEGGDTFLGIDLDGDRDADFLIELAGTVAFAATDYIGGAARAPASPQQPPSVDGILGTNGNDIMNGGSGDQTLRGLLGNDTLGGGGGNDVLIGGGGKDLLTGGSGLDRFVFETLSDSVVGTNRDRIQDFQRGSDKIDLSGIDAVGSTSANEAFTFIGSAGFSGRAGELHLIKSGTVTVIEGDVNGDRIADFQIELGTSMALTANDFIL